MGLSREACQAGYIPETNPTATETDVTNSTAWRVTAVRTSASAAMACAPSALY